MAGLLAFIVIAAISTKKYAKSVADFLAASRCARRYLLCVAGGCTFAIVGMVSRMYWESDIYPYLASDFPGLLAWLTRVTKSIADNVWGINWKVAPDEFPIDGQWWSFFSILIAVTGYVGCSPWSWLVLKRPDHNMDRLLHRGEYAVTGDHVGEVTRPPTGIRAILPTAEFSRGDRIIYYAKLVWTLGWWGIFLVGTLWGVFVGISDEAWANLWWWQVMLTVVVAVGTTIWFCIGGLYDLKDLFHTLRTMKRDHLDVGMVPRGESEKR